MIELKHVTKIIKKNKVLDDISYTFEEGNVYGVKSIFVCKLSSNHKS